MELDAFAARRGGLVLASDLTSAGADARVLRRRLQEGNLARVRRGCYFDAVEWAKLSGTERYRLLLKAVSLTMVEPPLFSHQSAAALHGLPLLGAWPKVAHTLVSRARGGRADPDVRRHGSIIPAQAVEVGGLRATAVVRTVVDLSARVSFGSAVVLADRALRNALTVDTANSGCTRLQLQAEVLLRGSGPGSVAARRVAEFADGRSASPGESLSRVSIHELGLPAPELQVEFSDSKGRMEVDFFWRELGLAGEFDGRMKYSRGEFTSGQLPEEVLWAEKQREERLRALGVRMIRWTWEEARTPRLLLERLHSAGVG